MNLAIFIISALISFTVITYSFKFERIVSFAVLAMIMVSVNVLGGSLIAPVLMTEASLGTMLYATLLFGLILMCDLYGVSAARKTVVTIFFVIFLFQIFLQFTLRLEGADFAKSQFDALSSLTSVNPRQTIASLMGFFVAGFLVIQIFEWLKNLMQNKLVWVISTVALLIAQVVDSIIFFGGSFLGDLSLEKVFSLIVGGILIKSILSIASIAFFFIAQNFREEIKENAV